MHGARFCRMRFCLAGVAGVEYWLAGRKRWMDGWMGMGLDGVVGWSVVGAGEGGMGEV